jgi:hypothetical protein
VSAGLTGYEQSRSGNSLQPIAEIVADGQPHFLARVLNDLQRRVIFHIELRHWRRSDRRHTGLLNRCLH